MDCVMITLGFIFLATFLASWALTLLIRSVALRWGVVDYPDGLRKFHPGSIPLGGGVAVYLSLIAGLFVACYCFSQTAPSLSELARAIILAGGFACFFGCVDDVFRLNARSKLFLQICSVLPVVMLGYYVESIVAFGYRIQLGWLGGVLTIFWLIGCINA
ncbi:MAG: hypothetical protein ACWGMZ_13390, partial [Thermoguttaceae bacterium]